MAFGPLQRFTRPTTFLYLMSLRTGTELIVLTLLINKLTGIYGVLALFTGYELSPFQLSMYIYSILALFLTAFLAPHIRKQSPLQCLALAWFYVIDSLVNALYTAFFGVGWFLVLANEHNDKSGGPLGGEMMDSTAGFTSPKYNVTKVDVVASPINPDKGDLNIQLGQETELVAHGSSSSAGAGGNAASAAKLLGTTILHSGSIASITTICALWVIRCYFILVVMAYARGVLRRHIVSNSINPNAPPSLQTTDPLKERKQLEKGTNDSSEQFLDDKSVPFPSQPSSPSIAENPFAPHREMGEGWKGKLGRAMVWIGHSYWLGPDDIDDEEESAGSNGRTGRWGSLTGNVRGTKNEQQGPVERERRRRAGTGPPVPMLRPVELGTFRK